MTPQLKEFMDSDKDGVFLPGHASALIRISGKLILVDPCWGAYKPYGEHWKFVPEQVNCDEILPLVDACVISHIHADHVCEDILKRLDCPVLIMSGRPALKERLEVDCHVMEFVPHQWHPFWPGIEFYFVPHSFNTVDSSCFVRSKDYCVYVGNDNFLQPELLKKVRREVVGALDVALVPYAFIHYYPHCLTSLTMSERHREATRLNKQSLEQAAMFVRVMQPTIAIPTGANLFYNSGADHVLNKSLVQPSDFKEAVPMMTGDYVLGSHCVGQPMPDYSRMLEEALGHGQGEPLDTDFVPKELFHRQLPPLNHTVTVNGLLVSRGTTGETHFKLDRPVFGQWLRGEITFEQALGTRRFTYSREPNVYNLEVVEWYSKFL